MEFYFLRCMAEAERTASNFSKNAINHCLKVLWASEFLQLHIRTVYKFLRVNWHFELRQESKFISRHKRIACSGSPRDSGQNVTAHTRDSKYTVSCLVHLVQSKHFCPLINSFVFNIFLPDIQFMKMVANFCYKLFEKQWVK